MFPARFAYHRPSRLEDAIALLVEQRGDVRCLAGGQSLIPSMKLRLAQPGHLVDLAGLAELRGIEANDGELQVGAMSSHRAVEASPIVLQHLPYLSGVAANIADPQVRNRGTIGGSLANADPAADYPASLLALGGTLDVAGPEGRRSIAADLWPTGLMATALADDEIVLRIRFPLLQSNEAAAYVKVPHPASRFATVGIATRISCDAQGRCTAARIAITGVGETVQRAPKAEAALVGSALDASAIRGVGDVLGSEIGVMPDGLLGEAAKRQLCRMTARRVLAQAAERALRQQ